MPDDKAREAAEEAADYTVRRGEKLSLDVELVKWIVGYNLALMMAVIVLLLRG